MVVWVKPAAFEYAGLKKECAIDYLSSATAHNSEY